MNILQKKPGTFIFLDGNFESHQFDDYDDIPEDLDIQHVVCFLPKIPPSPHTLQDHELINSWNGVLIKLMEKINGTTSN
jgi:hypothetical protein